jgi:hypothetical protein
MKLTIRILATSFILVTFLASTSCSSSSRTRGTVIISNGNQGLPPGQAKKVYGTQSAKPFAPGQQKKQSGTTVIVKQ